MRHFVIAGCIAVLLVIAACQTNGATPSPDGPGQPASGAPSQGVAASTSTPEATTEGITVTSEAFIDGGQIPAEYACGGQNVSPPLAWTGVPEGTAAVALVMDDPDAVGGLYIHWVVSDIAANTTGSARGTTPAGGQVLPNSGGNRRYLGPCPPQGSGVHHYRFTLYALAKPAALAESTPAGGAVAAFSAGASARGQLIGTYAG